MKRDPSSSGEQYISALLSFFEQHGAEVAAGRVSLQLHPRGLQYIAGRLRDLESLDQIKRTSAVEYLRACANNLQDLGRLERLHNALARARSVRLASSAARRRDPTRVDLSPFRNLQRLELYHCDLSTQPPWGLAHVKGTLRYLACTGSLEQLRHLLGPLEDSRSPPPLGGTARGPGRETWQHLEHLSLVQNDMPVLDASLRLAPALRTLDLSGNGLTKVGYLDSCRLLSHLYLSDNLISDLVPLSSLPLTHLHLQSNLIRSTEGLDTLLHLVDLNLKDNLIADIAEVERLAGLTKLESLQLAGNPITELQLYRMTVLAVFPQAGVLRLDGQRAGPRQAHSVSLHRAKGGVLPNGWKLLLDFIEDRASWWGRLPNQDREEAGPATSPQSSGLGVGFLSPLSSLDDSCDRQYRRSRSKRSGPRRVVTFPYGSKAVDESRVSGVSEEALAGPGGAGGTADSMLGDRPTSPLVIGFEAEAGEALETRGQSLVRSKVHAAVPAGSRSAVLHPPDGSDVVTRRLDSLDSFPEDDFRQSLNRQQGEGYDADAVPQSAEQEAPLGTSGLDPTGTQLPEGARFPHFSPDVTAPVFSGPLGQFERNIGEWQFPPLLPLGIGGTEGEFAGTSPDTSPPSSPGSWDSPLPSLFGRDRAGGTGPGTLARSNSKLLMRALKLSDSPQHSGVPGSPRRGQVPPDVPPLALPSVACGSCDF